MFSKCLVHKSAQKLICNISWVSQALIKTQAEFFPVCTLDYTIGSSTRSTVRFPSLVETTATVTLLAIQERKQQNIKQFIIDNMLLCKLHKLTLHIYTNRYHFLNGDINKHGKSIVFLAVKQMCRSYQFFKYASMQISKAFAKCTTTQPIHTHAFTFDMHEDERYCLITYNR